MEHTKRLFASSTVVHTLMEDIPECTSVSVMSHTLTLPRTYEQERTLWILITILH